ncbi:SIR2-domain-containing protein [Ramicandelaber brevisporus]|nr:SIR2-domain-containing protein [Ramicandelaber brevisporus]
MRNRPLLESLTTPDHLAELISRSSNIVVITGAGISVSCGIPDFRSARGIYVSGVLDKYNLSDPQEMFDINIFRETPEIFYSFARNIYPAGHIPSPTHQFIRLLEQKGKLLRNYTQNIDTLEKSAGIENVIFCHGSFATARCIKCKYAVNGKEIFEDIQNQTVAYCHKCAENWVKTKVAASTNEESIDYTDSRPGPHNSFPMKPDITFFGEDLPDVFYESWPVDASKADLIIVIGSSLTVAPVSEMASFVPHTVPLVMINMEPIKTTQFDIQMLGKSDDVTAYLAKKCGWELEHASIPGGNASSVEYATLYEKIKFNNDPPPSLPVEENPASSPQKPRKKVFYSERHFRYTIDS